MESKKLKTLLSVLGILLSAIVLYFVARNFKNVENIIITAGIAGPAVAILLYGLLAPTPITTDALTIMCGAVYGPVYGGAIAWMGNNVAAMVEYFIGTRINKSIDFEKEKSRLPFGLGKLPIDSIPVLTLGRTLPFYGSKIISIMAGMYGVSYRRYIWTTALVNLVGTAMFSYGGFRALDYLKGLFN